MTEEVQAYDHCQQTIKKKKTDQRKVYNQVQSIRTSFIKGL